MEQRTSVTEMIMLKWMNGVAEKYKIRNEYVRASVSMVSILENMKKNS